MRVVMLTMLLLLAWAPAASAESCGISTTGVSFGAYDVFRSGPTDSAGTLTYECSSGGRPISISLERQWWELLYRSLESGNDRLYYNLYLDASRTQVWADGNLGSQEYINPRPPKKVPVTVPIYGRIPSGQDVNIGQYGDTVTVVVNF